ncbi:MAG TPA: GTPase HflX [Kofleriaceae bacterium]
MSSPTAAPPPQNPSSSPRPAHPRRAQLVGVALGPQPVYEVEEHLDELAELAATAGAQVVGRTIQRRPSPDSATFIGGGKVEEIARETAARRIDLVVFDDDLSGGQLKVLEQKLGVPVLDRSSLILDIFEHRARSREARTQVELAKLQYELPRLTRRWGHLSRQAGGIGVRGGEGETQLEADRRVLRQKIARLERDLENIERTRRTQRERRTSAPTVALAGYTNAGKSTLFNALTHADALAENRLFATLDTKMRRAELAPAQWAVVADTVGFIRKLPHHLVASFRSTLEETAYADVVVHVVDRSHPAWEDQQATAAQVLDDLGVARDRILTVWNKVDRLAVGERLTGATLSLSALTGEGLPALRAELLRRLSTANQRAAG